MKRAGFVAASSAAFAGAPAIARAQTPAKIHTGATPVGDIVIILAAQQAGIFQKYGLDADVQKMNSSAATVAAVVGGSLDIGKSTLFGLIVAHSKGIPIVLVTASALYLTTHPDAALVVAQGSSIKTPADLNGKIVASASLGDLFTTVNSAWIDANGGDSRTVKYLELPGSATADAIAAGRVDAGTLAEPILSDAVRSGRCRVIGYPEDVLGKQSIATAWFCTEEYAAKNAAALKAFRRACDESVAYIGTHQPEAIALSAKFSGIDPKNIRLPQLGRSADLRDTRLSQSTIDIAAKYKAIAKLFSIKDMIDPSVFATS